MKVSHWPTGDYPIYIDPTLGERMELAKQGWDTLRVCVLDDGKDTLCVASGHGNTHHTVLQGAKKAGLGADMFARSYIIYKDCEDYWFNLEDMTGDDRADFRRTLRRFFSEHNQEILSDIVNNSKL